MKNMFEKINTNLFYFLALCIFTASCSKDDEVISPKLTPYNESVVSYFKEVALGFEFGNESKITRRWEGNMKIFIGGQLTPELLAETNKIINEINDLSTTEFSIELVSDTLQSNFYFYLGSGNSYANLFPSLSELVTSNWGLFYIFWDSSNKLFKGSMYV